MVSLSCPKCGSDSLKILKKKSQGQISLTFVCLNCNHRYKPEEAKQKFASGSNEENELSSFDAEILHIYREKGRLEAIKHCKTQRKWDLRSSKHYVDNLATDNGFPKPKEGCFIATACYGDYDAPEVLVLRKYRDHHLSDSIAGRSFIRIYYLISPFFAKLIENSDRTKSIIRKQILNRIIRRILK